MNCDLTQLAEYVFLAIVGGLSGYMIGQFLTRGKKP